MGRITAPPKHHFMKIQNRMVTECIFLSIFGKSPDTSKLMKKIWTIRRLRNTKDVFVVQHTVYTQIS